MGYWLLAMGNWVWAIGWGMRRCRYLCLYTLHSTLYTDSPCLYTLYPTLYTISASAPASNLSPYRLIVCQRQCFDADATGRCRSDTK